MVRRRRARPIWLAVPLVLLFFSLALDSLVGDSPTMDEQNHVARGLAFVRTGNPQLSVEHPPLVNVLSALPLLTLPNVRLPTDHPSWQRPQGWYEFADLLLWSYNHDADRMIFLARLPIVFLTLGLALVGYRFSRQLWGHRSGLAAFGLLLFDPNILAHGRYATTDAGGTAFLLLATYHLWRMWQHDGWSWKRWLGASFGLGLAFGSKLSAIAFVPIFAVMAVLPLYPRDRSPAPRWPAGRRVSQLVSAGLLSLMLLWATFGFQWEAFSFRSSNLTFLNEIRGPMPTFWAGVEQILGFTSGGRGSTFLLGDFSDHGFIAYFPTAFATKTPLAVLLLLPIAGFILVRDKVTRARAIFLLLPATLFFLLSMSSALNIGYRHLLPILPFLLVCISGLAGRETCPLPSAQVTVRRPARAHGLTKKLCCAGPYLALLALLIADLWIHPHYLSFFNLASGGPKNGWHILVDSNIDWGQDLLRLKSWMAENEVAEVNLGWFGSADPGHYGIPYRPLPGLGRDEFFRLWWDVPFDRSRPAPGVYAISASNMWELPLREDEKTVYAWFRGREPDARVGYSILIYDVR